MDICIDHISKSYGQTRIFSDFSCIIARGSMVGIFAPSGAGKTTFLRLILGLEKPDSGHISGVPRTKSAVFQEDRLIPKLGSVKNLCIAGADAAAAQALLNRLGLEEVHKPVCQLSGGQARRVALARGLLAPGELLTLDEPFSALDDRARERAADAIRDYSAGRTVLLVTHREADFELLGIENRIYFPGS